LLSHYLERKMGQMSENMGRSVAADIFNRVVKLKELDPSLHAGGPGQAELASILADQGLVDEARKLLPEEAEILPEDAETLFAIAKVALLDGDEKRSWLAASRLLTLLDEKSALHKTMVWGVGLSLTNLGRLLLAIHKTSEAAQVLEHALQICPNEASLLKLLAQAYQSAHLDQKVAQTLHTLVSLNPDDLDFRRAYARSLEAMGDWDASLDEWVNILKISQATATTLQDKYDYAHCAIMANQPRLALEACTEILDQNQEDSQALIYSGQAYLVMDETDKGMELLTRATQIEPNRPETWMALVEAQQNNYPLETLLETLKNASQAVPRSAQIHFTLGDLFLQDNQPTLALPELQAAVELSPQEPQYLVNYAGALQVLGHDSASLEMFTRAYHLEPSFPGLALTYARSLMDLGRLEDAIAPYETLIDSTAVREPGPYLDYARCVLALNRQG
jgi:tetratricopeptide (TPR) repeat protein